MSIDLTPETRLAIEAGVKQALKDISKEQGDARDGAAPDRTHEGLIINLTLEVDKLAVGHDTDKTPTASIPLLPALALMVSRMGATRDAALEMLKEVMEEALALDKAAAKKLMEELGVAEAEKAIKEQVISTLPRTPVKKTAKVKGVRLTLDGVAHRPTPTAD